MRDDEGRPGPGPGPGSGHGHGQADGDGAFWFGDDDEDLGGFGPGGLGAGGPGSGGSGAGGRGSRRPGSGDLGADGSGADGFGSGGFGSDRPGSGGFGSDGPGSGGFWSGGRGSGDPGADGADGFGAGDGHGHGEHGHGIDPALSEELRRLVAAVADRAEPLLRRVSDYAAAPPNGALPATCQWCPVCAVLAVARGQRPELAVRAAEQAVLLAELLRTALGEPPRQAPHPVDPEASWTASGTLPDTEVAEQPTAPPQRPRVQHIEVRRRTT